MWTCPEFLVKDILPFVPDEAQEIREFIQLHQEEFGELIYKETVEKIFEDYPDILTKILESKS